MPWSGIAGSYGNSIFRFLRTLHAFLHSDCTNLFFCQQCQEVSLFSTPSPAFIICILFNDGHSDWCEVRSHCSFDLHFSNNGCGEGNGTPLQYSCLENSMDGGAWWAAAHGVAKSRAQLSNFTFTFHFHALEKEMATHSSVLAWRIPGTGEPGGLPSMGSQRVGHD